MGVDILEIQSLLGLYTRYRDAAAQALDPYFTTRGNTEEGPSVNWDVLEMGRGIAKINTREGEPNQVKPPTRANITATGLNISEGIRIPPSILNDLRAPGELRVANGEQWVGWNILELRQRKEKRLELLKAQLMGQNASNPGYLQFRRPGLSTDTTVSLGFAAGHLAIGSAWSTSSTDIIADIQAAKLKNIQDSGVKSDAMWLTSTVMGYIINNDQVNAFLSDIAKDEIRTTGRIKELCELELILVDAQYDATDAGSMTNYWPTNGVVIGPKTSTNRQIIECSPVSIHAPAGSRGMFLMTRDEAGIKGGKIIEYEWTGLPVYITPDEIMSDVDVTA